MSETSILSITNFFEKYKIKNVSLVNSDNDQNRRELIKLNKQLQKHGFEVSYRRDGKDGWIIHDYFITQTGIKK